MSISVQELSRVISGLQRLKLKSKTGDYFNNQLLQDPQRILRFARESRRRVAPEQEKVILGAGAKVVEQYMKDMEIKEWEEAEPILAQETQSALWYSLLSKKPFPEGEKAIASVAKAAWVYATEVLKKRFPEGEPVIQSKPGFWEAYKNFFGVQ